jgi:hypothetical protein
MEQIHIGGHRLCNQTGEAIVLKINTTTITTKFMHDCILIKLGCSITIVIN